MNAQNAANSDVLRRKVEAGRRAAASAGMPLEKALARAFARAAETQWNLALVCRDVRKVRLDQAGAEALMEEGGLILGMDAPEGELGFALFDRALVAGLTEIQTFGIVTPQSPEERAFTDTDAAMTAALLDPAMMRMEAMLEGQKMGAALRGFRYAGRIETARIAGTLLDAESYVVLRAQVELAGGRRIGRLALILPEVANGATASAPDPAMKGPLGAHAHLLHAPLEAVLCRLNISLASLQSLKPGDTLPLPVTALGSAELRSPGGALVARGSLGRLNGQRAFRVGGSDEPGNRASAEAPVASQPERVEDTELPAPGDPGRADPLAELPPLDFGAAMAELPNLS